MRVVGSGIALSSPSRSMTIKSGDASVACEIGGVVTPGVSEITVLADFFYGSRACGSASATFTAPGKEEAAAVTATSNPTA